MARLVAFVADELGVDPARLHPETSLVDDLDVDSLDILRLAAGLDADFDVALPEELLPEILTVADLHHYVAAAMSRNGR